MSKLALCVLVALVFASVCVDAGKKLNKKAQIHAAVLKGKKLHNLVNAFQDGDTVSGTSSTVTTSETSGAASDALAAPAAVDADCEIGSWILVSSCNVSCGGGMQEFRLNVMKAATGAGKCPETVKYEPCHTQACPVDCECSKWSPEPTCPTECGGTSTVTVTRTCKFGNEFGERCGPTQEQHKCNDFECPINCAYTEWEPVGVCTKSCGTGSQVWSRKIHTQAAHGGAPCIESELSQTQECNTHPCPVDCEVSEFKLDGTCSKECGGGTQKLKREITTKPDHGGAVCPELEATTPCNMHPCPVDCKLSEWEYDPKGCSKNCGGGKMTNTRKVIQQPSTLPSPGQPCGDLTETVDCNTFACPQDCEVGPWTPSTTCSRSCGGGEITYTRKVTKEKNSEGADCPALTVVHPCNTDSCESVREATQHATATTTAATASA